MNLYLVLAIALGAITGVTQTPTVRTVSIVAQRERRAQRREARRFPLLGSQFSVLHFFQLRTESRQPRTNRGNTAPRAPAVA